MGGVEPRHVETGGMLQGAPAPTALLQQWRHHRRRRDARQLSVDDLPDEGRQADPLGGRKIDMVMEPCRRGGGVRGVRRNSRFCARHPFDPRSAAFSATAFTTAFQNRREG
jgi:hypothetical protein